MMVVWLVVLLVSIGPAVSAQEYKFSLDRNISHVYVNADGSADIEYILTYTCAPGAHVIDIVDIGLPNSTYDLSTARAQFSAGVGEGQKYALSGIFKSEMVAVGVEIHLGEHTIQPGRQGTIFFRINIKEMVYPDSKDKNYASLEFAPHYYDRQNVQGKTYMEINFHFPPGLTKEEPRYHKEQYHSATVQDGRFVFTYVYPDANGYETHKHGISFPRTYVTKVYKAPLLGSQFFSGLSKFWNSLGNGGCIGFFFVFFFVIAPILSAVQGSKRKMKYLPPALSVEGVGIKRGLTAVEAAILLETPLNKVMTMILFGLLKKRGVVVLEEKPLKLEKVDPLPQANWRDYELEFLGSIKGDGTLDEKKLQKMTVELIKELNTKLKGFSRKETTEYYKSIVDRAWQQVQSDTTPEVQSRHFDQGLEWMMMDKQFEERTQKTFTTGPVFMPPWWAYYRPWRSHVSNSRMGSSSGSSRPSIGGGQPVTLPTLPGAAFAGAVVGGIERTASSIVGKVESFTGGVTQVTNPPPVSSSSGGRSSGGCACACACAGCACACAGGGR